MADRALAIRTITRVQFRPRLAWLLPLALFITLPQSPSPANADESQGALRLTPERVRQGGIVVLNLAWPVPFRNVRLQVGDREVHAPSPDTQIRMAMLVGIDLAQAPGDVLVRASALDKDKRPLTAQQTFRVLDAHFPVQRLTVPRAFVELDPATLERVNREKAVLDHLWETVTPERLWRGSFRLPLDGAASAAGFGERRIINGEPRAPHSGTDISAPPGTPVSAANAGTVALVAEHFFAGTSIILDHGFGLYTMYFHLQESLVQAGQRVNRDQLIGRVGSSGRATGPHLHWGARLYGARIDPRELLKPLLIEE